MGNSLRPNAVSPPKEEMRGVSLGRYLDVSTNHKYAKFQVAKKLPANFSERDSEENLWKLHARLTEKFYHLESDLDSGKVKLKDLEDPHKSYLDLKVEIAKRILVGCRFCMRHCGVNRLKGEKGVCGCGKEVAVSTFFAHMGEEAEVVPSGTIFTCGCTLKCLHCQNWTISQWEEKGDTYTSRLLAGVMELLREQGCRNANLVGGDPTPWLEQWLEAFRYVKVSVPVIWNSNSYYSPETANLLAGFIDLYLLDLKYGDNQCAERISGVKNYVETARLNHLHAAKYGELLIRVLLLPDHFECCGKPTLKWIAEKLGANTRVNIMDQYRPEWRAHEISELRRHLPREQYRAALDYAAEIGLRNLG